MKTNQRNSFFRKAPLLKVAMAVMLAGAASSANVQAQIQNGCINNAISNGSLVTTTNGDAYNAANITNWSQTTNAYPWHRDLSASVSRPGMDLVMAGVDMNYPTTYLSQNVTNVAKDNDSLTIFIHYALAGSSGNLMPKLNVYWTPGSATFNASSHKRAEVRLTGAASVTSAGYNGAVVAKASIDLSGAIGTLVLRIPHSGAAPASGMISIMADRYSGNSGGAVAGLLSVYMPSHTCTNTPSPTQQPFNCGAGYAYLSQDSDGGYGGTVEGRTGLYRVNLATGAATLQFPYLINQTQTDFVQTNALGYNPVDNYLWAYRLGTNQIVRIGSDGSTRFYKVPGLYGTYASGDIDDNGIYYLMDHYSKRIDRIDLNTMTLLSPIIPAAALQPATIDIAINPVDGMIYVASKGTHTTNPVYIQKIDKVSGAVTTLFTTSAPSAVNSFGALYFDNEGNLYGSQNTTGAIWKFTTDGSNQATFVANGPVTNNNDGARCPTVPIVPTVSISGSVWNDANEDAAINGIEVGVNPGTLHANLVDDNGKVVASVPVGANGSYTFSNVEATGVYSIILTNIEKNVGSSLSTSDQLPGDWAHTGTNVSGTPNTGNQSGIITGITTGGNNVSGLNFGINDTPPCPPGTELAPVIN